MQPNLPQDIGTELEDIRRRLRALETSPSMQYTAQKGGSFQLLSPTTGRAMEIFGQFTAAGSPFYGIEQYDGDGTSVMMTRDDTSGLVKPDIPMHFHSPAGVAVSGATFTSYYEWQARTLYHDSIAVDVPVATDATATGELRISEVVTSTITAVLSIPINANGTARFLWKHGIGLGDDGAGHSCMFQIQARLTSGGGVFTLYPPRIAVMTSSVLLIGAAANGNPQLL